MTRWLEPGQTGNVLVYAPIELDRDAAVAHALPMVAAHDCEMLDVVDVELQPLHHRWAVKLRVRRSGPAQAALL